ncbi:translocation/assembly module TamB domain-containing protein [Niabella beijingensis]|uniref:translocation/assembly module TamB domain-containing protein n=1 Tax=Niabella beijingensis TaxID=2872700 RepID=UPI001CC13CD6|nr:translocation/assembly module TamB domain-containing protein [Niabella beijingensis]MBZ4187523.1 translocation/assembly module TamB domain-containing protein [Niabella beijingensis]
MNKAVKKGIKIILKILAGIIVLVILLILSLNLPFVQNLIKNKVVQYLKKKTDTEISLERIRIGFPKDLELNKLYVADKKKDTLLYTEKLGVDLDMLALLSNRVEINSIELDKVRANVYRLHPDTVFNYQFLVDSLISNEEKTPEDEKKDTTSTLRFRLDKITFNDIRIRFRDDVSGNDAGVFLGNLDARVKTFDLDKMHYALRSLAVKNTRLHYFQNKPLTVLQQKADSSIDKTATEKGGRLPLIEFAKLALDNVSLQYDDRLSDTRALAELNAFHLDDLALDLTNGSYRSSEVLLQNSLIDFAYRPTPTNEKAVETAADSAAASSFGLLLGKVIFANNRLRYDNLAAARTPGHLDFNHLNIKELGLTGNNISIDSTGIKAAVLGGKLKDTSGFVLNDLKGDIVYDDRQLKVDGFILKTPYTRIDNNSLLSYTSQEDLSKHPEKVKMDVQFRDTRIGMQDLYYLLPSVPASYRSRQINLAAAFTGYLNDLDIDKLQIHGLNSTNIDIAGGIKGLPDLEKTVFNLNLRKLQTSKSDLLSLVPATTMPQSIELPGYLSANGKFNGSLTNFTTGLQLKTDMGGATLQAAMGGPKNREIYRAKVQLNNFNLGRLLKQQDQLGTISLLANISGQSLDPKKMRAKLNGTIYHARYNRYDYKNIKLEGSYAGNIATLNAISNDSNAHFTLDTKVDLNKATPAIKGTADLKNIDLQKLNFYTDPLKLAGLVDMDFSSVDPDYLNGSATLKSVQIGFNESIYNIDTLTLNAVSTREHNELTLSSDFMTARFSGKYQLTQTGQAFINQINKYYAFAPTKKIAPQQLQFNIVITDPGLIQKFVPALTTLAPATIDGNINTLNDSLRLNAAFPHVVYDSFDIKDIQLKAGNTDSTKLDYALNIKAIQSPSVNLYNAEVSGAAANNLLDVNLFLRDRANKDKYQVGGQFKSINETYQFMLDPQKLLLNYDPWKVAADNMIQYGKAGVYVRNFEISNNGQSLAINSRSAEPNAPVNVKFTNFMLETLTRYADQDTAMVGGKLNGVVDVTDIATSPKFEADLTINQLRYQKDALGDATIKVNNNTANAYQADVRLTGLHDLAVTGFYYTGETGSLDLDITVNKIDLKHIESVTGGQIRNGKGILTGNLTAKGPVSKPVILGALTFKDAGLNIAQLNGYYQLRNETVRFVESGISFNKFTIRDSANQPLTLDGMITTRDFSNPGFNLTLRANNFRVMNSTIADNELFYGTVLVTLNARINGDLNKPKVDMQVRINKGTKFNFVIPDDDPLVASQEGIVEFIDKDAPPFNGRQPLNVDSLTRSPITGVDISGDITIDKEAEITIVVDPQNGDALRVKGEADLSLQMDPSGRITLTGRYEITEGGYNLTIGGLAKREFKIQQGSSIQWTGAPTEANADITAIYEINTSPIDLVSGQIDPADNITRTKSRQKLPFYVYLKMNGELLKPTLSFQIDMRESDRNALDGIVYTRLQQVNANESELNKQVFALLALNRFISDNPFESLAGGTSAGALARQSVSKLLTEQLNNLASDLIKGVDINFDLTSQEDYSTGQEKTKTDLNVAFTKRLLNDRLSVTVGNNFALEGANANQNAAQLASNVNIEYMLSRDGRYRLRAYRRNQTEGIIEGQIIETGVGFIIVVDYNRFREVFRSFRKRDQRRGSGSINGSNRENKGDE